jgi:DDE superfamily endonuclease/Archaeal putative transposase ISC1217
MQPIVAEIISIENQINQFFHNHSIGTLLRQCNIRKEKGIPMESLFQFLLALAFTGKSMFRHMEPLGSFDGIFKDVGYRLQNSIKANWGKFLLLLSTRIVINRLEPLTDPSNLKVLIADDTLYLRDRSKRVELLARVHDHNTGRYHKGFRMLTLGWCDGGSFIPILLAMLSSAKEKNRLAPMRDDLDKRTNGYKRRKESTRKSTDVLVDMVSLAIAANISARHLLFDSWFAFPATIRTIKALEMDTVCMLKDTPTINYTFEDKKVTLKKLFTLLRKRPGRAKVLASCMVTIGDDDSGKPVPAKIVFIRHRNTKSWLAILSTDTTLTDQEIVTLYKRRWDIETFFKIAKSFLKLAKECQSRSFDAIVANATLVCCRYIMLAIGKRTTADPKTLGTLFFAACDEIQQTGFCEALALLLNLLMQTLKTVGFSKEQVLHKVAEFIDQLPPVFKERLLFLLPESEQRQLHSMCYVNIVMCES